MLLRRLRWGLAGVLVAWTLVRAFGLERGWPLVPLLAFTPYVALLALVVAGLAAWRRWWAGAAVAGACAALLLALLAPRAIPNRAPADAPGVRVRVLAANVAANEAAAEEVIAAIRRWDVDVFSAIELPPAVVLAYDARRGGVLVPQPRAPAAAWLRRDRALLPAPARAGALACAAPPSPSPPPSCAPPGAAPVDLMLGPPAGAHRRRRDRAVAARPAVAAGRRGGASARAGGRLQRDVRPCRIPAPARPRLPRRRRAGRGRAAPHLAGGRGPPPTPSRSTMCWSTAASASFRPAASPSPARTTGACSPSCCCRVNGARSARSAGRGRRPGRRTPR